MNKLFVILFGVLFFTGLATANSVQSINGVQTDTIFAPGTPVVVSAVDLNSKTTLVKQNGMDVAKVELLNKVANGNLQDCDIVSCELVLNITPLRPISLRGLQGQVLKSLGKNQASFSKALVEQSFEQPVFKTIDNSFSTLVLNQTTGRDDSIVTPVFYEQQVGTKTVKQFVDLDQNQVLSTNQSYLVKLVFNRKYKFGAADDLSVFAFGFNATSGALDPWWNTTFANYINFTVNTTATGNLTNFPVYVSFDSASLISGGTMDAQCAGIRAVDKTDSVAYSMELENGTCNTVNTTVWVLLPTASSVPYDNEIHLYYNNQSAVLSVSNGQATFINNFTQVLHLGETSSNFSDSSPSGWHSQSITNVTRVAAGNNGCRRGGCAWVGANNGNVNFGNVGGLSSGDKLSLGFFINMSPVTQSFIEVYSKGSAVLTFGQWTRIAYAYLQGGDQIFRVSSGAYGVNSWTHQAFTWTAATGSSAIMYINGSSATAAWDLGTGNTAPGSSATALQLAPTVGYIGTVGWTGVLDEVRRANVTRSADWVKAEYGQTFTNQGTASSTSIPAYTSVSTTPANFSVWSSGLYVSFNVSWNNTPTSEVFNLDGVNTTVTVNANLSSTKLSAGYHSWYSFANNTGGANQTPTYSFYLQPANATLSLLLNGSAADLSIQVYNASNASVSSNTAYAVSVSLLRNGTVIQTASVPPQLDNYSEEIFAPQTVNWTAKFNGDANYTAFLITRFVSVGFTPATSSSGTTSAGSLNSNDIIFEGADDNPALSQSAVAVSLFSFLGVLFVAVILMPKSKPKEEED